MIGALLSKKNKKGDKGWDKSLPLTSIDGPLDRGDTLRTIAAYYADGRFIV
jgi:hypothetical protein